MDIYTATNHFTESIKRLFPHHTVKVLPESPIECEKLSIDLLVFTGGSDINPVRYGRQAPDDGFFNLQRDEIEFGIIDDILQDRLNPKKVLGICRGHQVLNVAFGGTLFYDFPSELGRDHPYVHNLAWEFPGPLATTFPSVNSMHHQGISSIGDMLTYKYLAQEPKSGLIESVLWGDRFLGVQWHPELMNDSFRLPMEELMKSWVEGGYVIEIPKPSKSYSGYSVSFKTSSFG